MAHSVLLSNGVTTAAVIHLVRISLQGAGAHPGPLRLCGVRSWSPSWREYRALNHASRSCHTGSPPKRFIHSPVHTHAQIKRNQTLLFFFAIGGKNDRLFCTDSPLERLRMYAYFSLLAICCRFTELWRILNLLYSMNFSGISYPVLHVYSDKRDRNGDNFNADST